MAILWAQGIVAETVLERIANGIGFPSNAQIDEVTIHLRQLARAPSEDMRWLFLSFADSEVFVGTRFSRLVDIEQQLIIPSETTLTAVTQQFSFPWESVPSGWKTISLFKFNSSVPIVIDELPILEGWSYLNKIGFSVESSGSRTSQRLKTPAVESNPI